MSPTERSPGRAIPPATVRLRRPTETDHPRLVRLVDEWFGGRRVHHLLGRMWFRHVASTSWLAEGGTDQPVGFLIGYVSQDRPNEAVLHLVAVDPNHRRRGIGRDLVEAFEADVVARGAMITTALAWPDEPIAVAFFRALDFAPYDGPGSQNLYGTPAIADYEADGGDRIVFSRERRGSP